MAYSWEYKIITRIKSGAVDEFKHLVDQYRGILFRIVGNLVKGPAVEDLVQDIFLAAFENIEKYDPERSAFRTWICRIARNHALNANKKKREHLLEKPPVITDPRTPCRDLIVKQAFDRLDQALDDLPFKERIIFVLSDLEGLSYSEIAGIEQIPLGTVKSRLFRAREKLRQALENHME